MITLESGHPTRLAPIVILGAQSLYIRLIQFAIFFLYKTVQTKIVVAVVIDIPTQELRILGTSACEPEL